MRDENWVNDSDARNSEYGGHPKNIPSLFIPDPEPTRFTLQCQRRGLESAPANPLWGLALVAGQDSAHRPRDALVQQDFHALAGASSAASERSRTRRAMSRVTEGKHSRKSSRV